MSCYSSMCMVVTWKVIMSFVIKGKCWKKRKNLHEMWIFLYQDFYLGEKQKVFLNERQNKFYGVNGIVWCWFYLL